jgi:hypothetical protein
MSKQRFFTAFKEGVAEAPRMYFAPLVGIYKAMEREVNRSSTTGEFLPVKEGQAKTTVAPPQKRRKRG